MRPVVIPDDIEFWEKVQVKSLDECWPYVGEATRTNVDERTGPPRIYHEGDRYMARRVAYKYGKGIYGPSGLQFVDVMPKCRNKQCCNPHHLTVGDEAVARLDDDEIEEIRESDASREEIMEEYGIEEERYIGYIRNSG